MQRRGGMDWWSSVCTLFVSFWTPAPYVVLDVAILLVLAFMGFCLKQVPGWMQRRGGMDWWSSVCRFTFPNSLAVMAILIEAVVLAWVGAFGIAGHALLQAKTAGIDIVAILACGIVGFEIIFETLPMVTNEEEQAAIVTAPAWRAATMVTKEVLLFPVVLVLTARPRNIGYIVR